MKQITEIFAAKFKRNYAYKMGGSQTLVFPNGQEFHFNDKEYYGGRGSKYNASIRHDNKGRIEISAKEVKEFMKKERERAKAIKQRNIERREKSDRIAKAKLAGIYSLQKTDWCQFVELSEEESVGKYFDVARLAATLDIKIEDALLLNSEGKTYVFAQKSTGEILELYHPSLSCNDLNISITTPTAERLAEFNHNEWISAPFAKLVGQTEAQNHFVC